MPNEQLVVQLEARVRDFERQMQKANATATRQFTAIERRGREMNSRLASSFKGVGVGAFAGMAKGALLSLVPLLSVRAAIDGAKAALSDFDKIGKSAKAAGLTAEQFQAVAYAANLGGVETDQFSQALQFFNRNAGLAAVKQGDMYTKLKALNPELLKSIEGATDQATRLNIAADAISKAGNASQKAALATTFFGRQGAAMVEVFKGGAAALEDTANKARDMGLVVGNEVIANAEKMNDRFTTATKILDVQFKSVLIDLAPLLVSTANGIGEMAKAIGIVVDEFKAVEDRVFLNPLQHHLIDLENQIASVKESIASEQAFVNSQPDWNPAKWGANNEIADQKKQLEDLYAEAAKYQDRIARLQGMGSTLPDTGTGDPPPPPKPPAIDEQAKRIAEVTTALQQQLDALGLTNREQAIASQLAAAHTTATTAEGAAIADLAGKLYDQREAILKNADAMRGFEDSARNALSTFINDLEQGKSAAAALGDVLGQLGSRILNSGLDTLFGSGSGSNQFGTIGKLFGLAEGGIVANGRPQAIHAFANGGISNTAAVFGEAGPEAAVPLPDGRRIPVDLRMPKMAASGGNVSVNMPIHINAAGADPAAVARLDRAVATMKSELPASVIKVLRGVNNRVYKVS